MKGKFVLISGTASLSCEDEKLSVALEFIQHFTRQVLQRGGGIVVLAGDEESTKDQKGMPHIFDWVALREVERYAERSVGSPRIYVRVVMSDKTREEKLDNANLKTLINLEQRQAVEVRYIQRMQFTGGSYRRQEAELSDALLAIGGGKGTHNSGRDMVALNKPVLPLDLAIGSISEDGEGAVELHREMMTDPTQFFPRTHEKAINRIGTFSLQGQVNDAESAARAAADLIHQEFEAAKIINRIIHGLRNPKVFIPIILGAISVTVTWLGKGFTMVRLFEFIKDRFFNSVM